ncbi:hypothetical protein Tco_0144226 [Tanacetum coccineum]
MRPGVVVDMAYLMYWIRRIGVSWSRDHARIRRIFLDGYGVLVVRIVIFKISSFKLQNARLLLIFTKYSNSTCLGLRKKYRLNFKNDMPPRVTMTKVINGEFEKLESLKINDVSLTFNTSLETFHEEFNWISIMDDDLFTYEARGDDEVELTDKESPDSDKEDEVAEIFRIKTNVHEKTWTDNGVWQEPTPVEHYCEPFSYKNGCSEWPTCSWRDDGYCNGGNLPGAYIVGNALRYQDFEWYEALEDGKLKEEALKNKAIMEGIIEDEDDESYEERCELFDDQERPVFNIRRFEMIKYSFGQEEEYVSVKEKEYDDLTRTSKDACHTYQEIFLMMDEGWMDLARKKSAMLVKYLQSGIRA